MADPFEGLDPGFAARLKKMVADSGGRITLGSGYRSVERQQQLWDDAVKKYGSESAARKWVAPPGKSNHNHGMAGDLQFHGDGKEWAHANAARYGLHFPMGHEPWHIEPVKSLQDEHFNPEAYTDPPIGFPPAADPTDPGVQFNRLLAILDGEIEAGIAGVTDFGLGDAPIDQLGVDAGGPAPTHIDSGASMPTFGFDEPSEEQQLMDELERDTA